MVKRVCYKCEKEIDCKKDLFCLLGTYEGNRTVDECYFHMVCWRKYFEDKTREKAQVITNAMQEKMMPIAKQLTEKLKKAIGQDDDNGGIVNYNLN